MDIDTLRLYEEEFLSGRMSTEDVVSTLSGIRFPSVFPSFDTDFLALFRDGTVYRKSDTSSESTLSDCVRPEQRKDKETTRFYLEAFDREVMGRPTGLRREHSCNVLETPEHTLGGALWYYFDTTRKKGIELYIDRLYVPPEFRRRSYGEHLVEETIAQERDPCSGVLLIAPENVIGFYRTLNFRVQEIFRDRALQGRKFALMYRKL